MNEKTKCAGMAGSWRSFAILVMILGSAALHAQPGGLDPTFRLQGLVHVFYLQPDGKIVASGQWGAGAGQPARRIARLNSNGSLDPTFGDAGPDGQITHLVPLSGGQILVGGDYGQFGGHERIRIARLLPTGALDLDWNADAVLEVSSIGALAVQPDGAILIGLSNIGGGTAGDGLLRLQPDGKRDGSFLGNGAVDGAVYAILVLPDGGFYIGGRFTTVGGVRRQGIARLKPDGSLDLSFDPGSGANGDVEAITLQPDGRLLIAGGFDHVDGLPRSGLARLQADGHLDEGFDAGEAWGVKSIAVQADGKIVIAGIFDYIQQVRRVGVARLLPQGQLDVDFLASQGTHREVLIQPDGLILVGGGSAPGLFRLLSEPGSFSGRFELDPATMAVAEGVGDVTITVRRYGGQAGVASVSYAAMLYSRDLVRGTLSFADGDQAKTFVVPISDDQEVDLGRIINLLLYEPSPGAQLGPNLIGEIAVAENDTGFLIDEFAGGDENAQVITLQVLRQGASVAAMQVDFATVDGTAKAGRDYIAHTGTLHFSEGETGQAISIALIDNPEIQDGRTFSVVLSNPGNGAVLMHGGVCRVGVWDVVSQIAFAGDENFATNEAAGLAVILVQRSYRTNNPVSIRYQASGGTAQAGIDYQPVAGTLDFAPGEILGTFTVPLLDNQLAQTNRTVELRLTNPEGGAVLDIRPGATARTLTILDDDHPGDLDFTFNAGFQPVPFSCFVGSLALTPDQKIMVAGPSPGLVRLYADGGLDPAFRMTVGTSSSSLLVASDGRIWIGDSGSPLKALAPDGTEVFSLPRWSEEGDIPLALQPDQKVIALAWLWSGTRLFRVHPDGKVDSSFADGGLQSLSVSAVAVQPDGRIVAGGSLPSGGRGRCVLRLNPDGTADQAFSTGAALFENNSGRDWPYVSAILIQPDGRILAGGSFDRVGGRAMRGLVRLNPDGSADATWDIGTGFDDGVRQLALQGDGRILAVGPFTEFRGVRRYSFARLDSDGTLDTSFTPELSARITCLALQSDGHILVGGDWFAVNGQARNGLARLRGDPEAAAGWVAFGHAPMSVPESAGTVALQVERHGGSRGRIIVPYAVSGGTAVIGTDVADETGTVQFADADSAPKTIVIRMLEDGVPDGDKTVQLSLGLPLGGAVRGAPATVEWTIQDDDCVIEFAAAEYRTVESAPAVSLKLARRGSLRGAAAVGYSTRAGSAIPGRDYEFRAGVARFEDGQNEVEVRVDLRNDSWGEVDQVFWVDLDTPSQGCRLGTIRTAQITIMDDDRPGTPSPGYNSSLPAWVPTPAASDMLLSAWVSDLALDSSQRVVALFSSVYDWSGLRRYGPSSVVRFAPDGSIDTGFWPGGGATNSTLPDELASALALREDGSVLVGTTTRLVRVNGEGQADPDAFGGVNGQVETLLAYPDGSFLVGGALKFDKPEPWCHLVRRKADGTPDPTFATVVATTAEDPQKATILAVTTDSEGRVLAGGAFEQIQGSTHWGLARLSPNGEIDPAFGVSLTVPSPGGGTSPGIVHRIVIQPDGRVLLLGSFSHVAGVARPCVARLMTDGSLDTSFSPALASDGLPADSGRSPLDLAVQKDGRIILAVLRYIDWLPDGFPRTEGRLLRLNPDGSRDPLFDANGTVATLASYRPWASIHRVLGLPDGGILIGGSFSHINGLPFPGLARINGGLALGFARVQRADADHLSLQVNTPFPAVLELQASPDLQSWNTIATDRVPAGPYEWTLAVPPEPPARFFRLRAQP